MKFIFSLLLSTLTMMTVQAQQNPFYKHYELYKFGGLEQRRFMLEDIRPAILALEEQPGFTVTRAGESVQGRDIFLVKVGKGKTSVLLWSQMHGDEPTATMALMDVFNFFKQSGDDLEAVRDLLLNELTIYFIPMLNPDGAAVYKRRNAIGIDLNRDALHLQSPEARLLKSVRDSIQADWGFNLHDQDILYAAGKNPKPASISLLAPPYDEEESVNAVRERAIQLSVGLNKTLQGVIPGQVGKWADTFEPRAFGDNMQKWGTSTVLIESGGYPGDPEKQYLRKLNFMLMMEGLQAIASKAYINHDVEQYNEIPENERILYNLIIRNAQVKESGKWYTVDIGINNHEVELEGKQAFYYKSSIDELGDMSVFYGYGELDASGMQAEVGEVYPRVFANLQELEKEDIHQLIQSGYTSVRMKELPAEAYTRLPLNILPEDTDMKHSLKLDASPNFMLKKEGALHYVIVNGFVYDVRAKENGVKNALVRGQK